VTPAAVVERFDAVSLPLWGEGEPEREPEPVVARTLADAVDASWSALEAGFTAECLLCGGTVHPRWSAGAGVVGGRCGGCGTELD